MGYNDEFSTSAICDIETVASPAAESMLDPVKAPGNYKDPFKVQTYILEKTAERIATASLEPDLCEVVAVGFDLGDQPEALTRAALDEAQLLEYFWDRVHGCRLIGFNILHFDLPVLIRRSQLLGIPYPQINMDRYRTPHIDLLQRLSFNGTITFRSLRFYKRRFDLDLPEDPTMGSDIPGLVAAGEWDLIQAHVMADVVATRALAMKLGFLARQTVSAQ